MVEFVEYTPSEADGVIFEFVESNKVAELSVPEPYTAAILGCSDARCEEDAILPGELLVLNNAGSIVEPDQIPQGIERILVVAHEKVEGAGCGACGLAAEVSANNRYVEEHGIPIELAAVGSACTGNTREQATNVAKQLSEAGYEAVPMVFNHVTGQLTTLVDVETYSGPTKELVGRALEQNAEYVKSYAQTTERGDMEAGQNPYVVSVMLGVAQTFSDLTEQTSRFNGPNAVFEVKPGGNNYTTFAQGSAQYPWAHALVGGSSFADTDTTIFVTHHSNTLKGLEDNLGTDPALAKYRENGGKVFGVVLNDTTYKVETVYQLQ
jgi:hypothetical protein